MSMDFEELRELEREARVEIWRQSAEDDATKQCERGTHRGNAGRVAHGSGKDTTSVADQNTGAQACGKGEINCVMKAMGQSLVIGAVSPVEMRSGWKKMDVTIDSGAAESVIPPGETFNYPLKQYPEDVYYGTASGEPLKNLGEVRLPMVTLSRRLKGMTFQSCDATKSLASVANMLDARQAVIFAPEEYGGSCVVDLETGDEEPLIRQDGNFIMQVWVPPPDTMRGFGRQP